MSSRQDLELELARLRQRYADHPSGRVFAPLADCQRKLGHLDDALQTCLAGLTRHPVYSSAQLILGKIFLDRGEDVSARVALKQVLELDAHNMLALRLLAEIAERRGELDEAESCWTQLAATDYDADLTDERLETIALLREQQAGPAARQPASVPEEEVFETPAVEDTAPEQDGVAVEAVSDAEEDNTPRLLTAKDAPTSEIATLTLAGIYAEQGFKAKALEIYRQIEARNPDLPGLRECIEAIELAFARVEREVVEELSVEADGLSGGLEIVARTAGPAEDELGTGPVPSEPLLAIDGEPVDPVGRDESRYHRFGEWLERVRPDDGD